MAMAMDSSSVNLLLRTAIRTFYPTPRQILIIDALLLHKVLHLEDLNVLLASQSKEVRTFLNPLRASRFVSTHTRREVRVTAAAAAAAAASASAGGAGSAGGGGSGSFGYGDRTVQRDYYYINILEAIDAIKYRIAKLRKQIESAYKADDEAEKQGTIKDWYCPRCKSEYDMMTVLGFDQTGADGFVCEKCGQGLVQDEERMKERGGRDGKGGGAGGGLHRKMKRLNEQLARLDELITSVDRDVESGRVKVHEVIGPDGKGDGGFERAWEERVRVRRADDVTGTGATGGGDRYVDVKKREKGPDAVKAENLEVRIRTEGEVGEEERRREEERRERIRKQNEMPEWHLGSAIGAPPASASASVVKEESNGYIKAEETGAGAGAGAGNENNNSNASGTNDLLKPDSKQAEMDEQMQQYLALIEEERAEEERKKKQAAEEEEEDDDDDDDDDGGGRDDEDDEDGFEEVLGTSVAGTPMSMATPTATTTATYEKDVKLSSSSSLNGHGTGTGSGNGNGNGNGIKREFADDSSEAATPMSTGPGPDTKRVKLESASTPAAPAAPAGAAGAAGAGTEAEADSEEDEDFEDV